MSTKEKHNLIRESFRVKRHTYGVLFVFLGYFLMLETKYMNQKWKTLPEFHTNDI